MTRIARRLVFAVVATLTVSCSAQQTPVAAPKVTGSEVAAVASGRPAWQQAIFTTADGRTATVADFTGGPVFVEFFATWCVNCRKQLPKTAAAAAALSAGDVKPTFLILSVETELTPSAVAAYQTEQNLPGMTFGVMSPEMLAAVVEHLGNAAITPPSTPHIIVDASGTEQTLVTGFEEPDSIIAALTRA